MCIEKFSCKKIPLFERTLEIIDTNSLQLFHIKSRNSILLEFNPPILFCHPDFDTASEHPSLVADTCRQQQTYSKISYFLFPFSTFCVRCIGKNV